VDQSAIRECLPQVGDAVSGTAELFDLGERLSRRVFANAFDNVSGKLREERLFCARFLYKFGGISGV
jgi:hypothetical protein